MIGMTVTTEGKASYSWHMLAILRSAYSLQDMCWSKHFGSLAISNFAGMTGAMAQGTAGMAAAVMGATRDLGHWLWQQQLSALLETYDIFDYLSERCAA